MAATATAIAPLEQFAADVRSGLTRPRKELPSKYFYDALGSALFEAICLLPEYGLTRADERVLSRNTKEIVSRIPHPVLVSELGSGSGRKTRQILGALCKRGPVSYYPIEISPKALASCAAELDDIDCLSIVGIEREYLDGLHSVAAARPAGAHMLVLFLGSTIGNFDTGADAKFLQEVRGALQPGDSLLLGTDLAKRVDLMLDAYNDSLGVTAAFNLNLLARINRELDGDFDLRHFQHLARFNDTTSSIEMHLVSKRRQVVNVRHSGLVTLFEEGETIWTETCHKYTRPEIARLATASGFRVAAQWVDEAWPFAESLFVAE
ncbi:L-histidine N(alpha)-methyltransferase [uncultured Paludibaculum sp.]|uniref:L-histidine N(alpha)-methyltransferase n=1 Tax=uncultured Paludibaculum sp. TaxID=1765020 RepID=UPI002AAAF825|nr:L-histidine N(alpha)-methyltransferase [uncultured Paludibaculum sp.]